MSDVNIEKLTNCLKLTATTDCPSRIILKADINSVIEYDYPKIESSGCHVLEVNYPNELWKKASIKAFVCPISPEFSNIFSKAKLKTGEHHTPPKGYPTKRSEYAVPEKYIFPLDTPGRVRTAMGPYFLRHRFASTEEKKRAAARILRVAKKFGMKISDDSPAYRAAHGKRTKFEKVTWKPGKKK